jgi:hypothetical protein
VRGLQRLHGSCAAARRKGALACGLAAAAALLAAGPLLLWEHAWKLTPLPMRLQAAALDCKGAGSLRVHQGLAQGSQEHVTQAQQHFHPAGKLHERLDISCS